MDEDYILLFDKKYNFHLGDFGTVYSLAIEELLLRKKILFSGFMTQLCFWFMRFHKVP